MYLRAIVLAGRWFPFFVAVLVISQNVILVKLAGRGNFVTQGSAAHDTTTSIAMCCHVQKYFTEHTAPLNPKPLHPGP